MEGAASGNPRMSRQRLFGGATLIELCVALAIVALLMTLTLAAIQASRLSARRVTCMAHLRDLNVALQHYHSDHGCFPFDFTMSPWPRCLPYLGESSLYREIDW